MSTPPTPLVVVTGSTGAGHIPLLLMPQATPRDCNPQLLYAGHNPIGWQIPRATDGITALCDQCALSPMGVSWPIDDFLSAVASSDLSFLRGLTDGADVSLSTMQIGAPIEKRLCIIVNLGHISDKAMEDSTANGTPLCCVTRMGLAFNEVTLLRSAVDEISLGHRLAHYLLGVPCSTLAVMPGFKDVPHGFVVAATSNRMKQPALSELLKGMGKPIFSLGELADILGLSPDFFHDVPADLAANCPQFFGDPQLRAQLLTDRVLKILSQVHLIRPDLASRMLIVADTACLVAKGDASEPNGLPVDHIITMAAARMIYGIASVCTSLESRSGSFVIPPTGPGRRRGDGLGYDSYVRVPDGSGHLISLEALKRRGQDPSTDRDLRRVLAGQLKFY